KAREAESAAAMAAAMMTIRAGFRAARRASKRLARARSGVAAVEFAFIAPIMIVLFFGVIEGSAAYSAHRKVMQSANMLADLVAQETSVTQDNLDDLFVGMEDVISSRDIEVDFTVTSVYLDAATNEVKVHWSRNSKGETPYPADSVYAGPVDAALLDDKSFLIVAETDFDYASPISQKIIGDVAMRKFASRWPRLTAKVQYCVSPGNCTS
ncbi:MAG TPA: pilus assembly protein, partial [Parvularculaceae bacterium]|nr:pilus assembly protein [Parvularculaceae bacterium]